jgi:hypothetical protein
VRLRLRPPRSEQSSSASRSGRSAIRANSLRDPRSVRPTAAVPCAEVRSASRPAGHSESSWSDNVSVDVERTPDSTSSSENLTQTFRSRRPRILDSSCPPLTKPTAVRSSHFLQQPSCELAITLDPEPLALRSTRTRRRRAVHRGAACAAHSNTVRRPAASWCQDVRMPSVPCSLSASTVSVHPSGACPASARPVSSVRCPPVRCPVPASGICVRIQVVRTGQFVERVDSHPARDRPRRHVTPPRSRPARRLPESKPGAWSWRRPRWQRRRRPLEPGVVTGDAWAVAWFDCLADREEPLRARIAVGRERVRGRFAHLRQTARSSAGPCCRRAADHDLGGGSPARGGLWPDSSESGAAPPRPKAAGGPR